MIQHEYISELRDDVGTLTPKLEKLIHVLEWVLVEEFTGPGWCGVGHHPHECAWLANAFVAKTLLGLDATVDLIDRLAVDRALRRLSRRLRQSDGDGPGVARNVLPPRSRPSSGNVRKRWRR